MPRKPSRPGKIALDAAGHIAHRSPVSAQGRTSMALFKRTKSKARGGEGDGEDPAPASDAPGPSGPPVALPSAVPSSGRSPGSKIPGIPNWHARSAPGTASDGDAVLSQKVWVSIADIIPRLPSHVVERGAVNPAQRLWFKLGDLAALAAGSNYRVRVGAIAEMCPQLFGPDLDLERDTELVFPWGRAFEQIAAIVPPRERKSPSAQPAPGAVPEPPPPAREADVSAPGEDGGHVSHIETLNRRLVDLEKSAAQAEHERNRIALELTDFRKRADARAKDLIAERDRLVREKTRFSGDLARAVEAHRKFVEINERETQRLAAALASSAPADERVRQLTDQVVALAAERDRIHHEMNETVGGLSRTIEDLRFDLRRATDERDALLSEKETGTLGWAGERLSDEREIAALARERDAAMRLKDIAVQDLNRLRDTSRRQIEALHADLARTKTGASEGERALRAERDQLARAKAELAAQLGKLVQDHRAQATAFAAEREALLRSREELATEAAEARAAREADAAAGRAALARLETASTEISTQLLQAKENARCEVAAMQEQFESSAQEHKAQVESLLAERERMEAKHSALRDQASARAAECERLRRDLERLSEQFERFRADSARQIAALSDEARKKR